MSAPVKLIVGLGNPSDEYADTRHNVGIWFVEALANQGKYSLQREDKFYGAIAKLNDCWLLKPLIYMNENWRAIAALARFYKIKSQEILVVYDELEFPVGVIRLKENGGHGGHNGIRNIIDHLETTDFYRLRIGIGHPGHKDQTIPYVLGRPHKEDRATILTAISKGLKIADELIQGKFEKAMHNLHS